MLDQAIKGNWQQIKDTHHKGFGEIVSHRCSHGEHRVDGRHGEEELRESMEQLRRAVETTVQALVMAVEAKDPYTAGHQRRMTGLAIIVGKEMGLPSEKIEGLRMAGVVHDIGKITLPTDILSKPSKLTPIEYSLVKEHSLIGYNMLKDVEARRPLAETGGFFMTVP
jgi:HD-GYP domain-containing protein (c-di-GMP phosphodiesterase class II)